MTWKQGLVLVSFAAAASVLAQSEERPEVAPLEPRRQPPPRTFTITALEYDEAREGYDRFSSALPELVHFVKTSTDIRADLRHDELDLSDPGALRAILLYLTGNDAIFDFGSHGKKKLGDYLRGGGLLYAEDVRPDRFRSFRLPGPGVPGTPFDQKFKALMKDELVLGRSGARWRKIPQDHPLYSSYFDFPDGPPLGAARGGTIDFLEMLEHRGRVAVIYSDLNLSLFWGDPEVSGRERGLQFGANLIVFALTQQIGGGLSPPR